MSQSMRYVTRRAGVWSCLCLLVSLAVCGCSRESTRIALESQRRADEVQQAVFDRQHEALCILLYRDLQRRLAGAGLELSEAQRQVVNEVWNDRDLVEFWAVQQERAKALRVAGVDVKLFSDQSVVDLLLKALEVRVDRARQGLAAHVAEQAIADGE